MGSKNLFDLMRKSRVVERKKRKDRAGGEPVLHNLTLVCDKSDKFDRIERTLVKLLEPMKLVGGVGWRAQRSRMRGENTFNYSVNFPEKEKVREKFSFFVVWRRKIKKKL